MKKSVLVQNLNFRYIWFAHLISQFGDSFFDVAIVVYIMSQTNNSAFLAGGVAVSAIIGRLIGGALAIRIIDFYHTKVTMVYSDVIRIILLIGLLFLTSYLQPPIYIYYLICFLLALFTALFGAARSKVVAEMIDENKLASANNADVLSSSLVMILSWLLGGVIYALFGVVITLIIDLLTFVLSLVLILLARWESAFIERSHDDFKQAMGEIIHNKHVRIFFFIQTSYLFFGGFYWSALPLKVIPLGGDIGYGMQGAAFGVGSLLMTFFFHKVKAKSTNRLYTIGIIMNIVGNLCGAVSGNLILFMCSVFIAGVGNPMWSVGEKLYIQEGISLKRQGSVWGLYSILTSLVLVPSWLLGSYLADMSSATIVMVSACVMQICLVGIFVYVLRRRTTPEF